MGVIAEPEMKSCEVCGAEFVAALVYKEERYKLGNRERVYCSNACKLRASRARLKANPAEVEGSGRVK